ncbi:MAG: flavodoxin [Endomicrobium sp.]|jgi:flavodoxin short chain|nr:flavodoxin [Endomicrobium sp.]
MSKIAVIYWSGTGNTESMAQSIAGGLKESGAQAEIFDAANAPADLSGYEKVAFGCPSMGVEVLEESVFEPYFSSVEKNLNGKKVALFGSYGWGDGQWMRDWAQRAKAGGANLLDEGLIQQEAPNEEQCKSYGKKLAQF